MVCVQLVRMVASIVAALSRSMRRGPWVYTGFTPTVSTAPAKASTVSSRATSASTSEREAWSQTSVCNRSRRDQSSDARARSSFSRLRPVISTGSAVRSSSSRAHAQPMPSLAPVTRIMRPT
jgi:hypothetical protein